MKKERVVRVESDCSYTVTMWGSHPDLDNDDCWTGTDHPSLCEAEEVFMKALKGMDRRSSRFILLEGPRGERLNLRENPDFVEEKDDFDDWKHEQAMQAGMAFGCSGYNDVMGYEVDE